MFVTFLYALFGLNMIIMPIYIYLIWNHNYWFKRGLRTARPLTLFGTFPSLITRDRNMVYDIDDVYQRYKHKNRAIGVFVTRKPEILVLDPELAYEILVTNFRHFHDTLTSSWINNHKSDKYASRNPFWCAGDYWKKQRSEIIQGLMVSRLRQAYPIWQSSCEKLLNVIEQKIGEKAGVTIEAKDLCFRYTAHVVSDFIWGIDAGTFEECGKPNKLMLVTNKWLDYTYVTRIYSYLSTLAPIVRRMIPYRLFPKMTDDFYDNLTKQAIQMRQKVGDAERPDFLNYLLQLKEQKNLSHDDIVGHAMTVLLDGYETSGTTLVHTLYLLAKYPDVQTKLRQEIIACRSNINSLESLQSLEYMDQCVHETLRMFTPLPNFSRICTEPLQIQVTQNQSYTVEKGMVLTIPVHSFHHDKDFFTDPETYRPERFDNKAHIELSKQGIYLPFSVGPRICVGMRVANMTIKLALVEILTHYEVRLSDRMNTKNSANVKSFVLTLDGDVLLDYVRL